MTEELIVDVDLLKNLQICISSTMPTDAKTWNYLTTELGALAKQTLENEQNFAAFHSQYFAGQNADLLSNDISTAFENTLELHSTSQRP